MSLPVVKDTNGGEVWNLLLFVAGKNNPRSQVAYSNLKRICEEHLPNARYTIEVVDIAANPQVAAKEQIIAIPALLRKAPPPKRRIIGDLSDTFRVLVSLGIQPLESI